MRTIGAMVLGALLFAGGMVTEASILSNRGSSIDDVARLMAQDRIALPTRLREMLAPVCTEENVIRRLEYMRNSAQSAWRGRPDVATLETAVWFWPAPAPVTRIPDLDIWVATCLTVLSLNR